MRRITPPNSSLPLVLGSLLAACGYSPEDAATLDESSSTTDDAPPTTTAGNTAGTTASTTVDPTGDPTLDPDDDSSSGSDPGDESEGSTDEGSDSTGEPVVPTVMGTFPGDDATGVRDDIAIIIVFSAAMDQAATQAAYQSSDLPAAAVTFAWDGSGSELTITPNDPLAYAHGSDPALLLASSYAVTITTAAQSLEGVALAEDTTFSFSTLRRLEQLLERDTELSGNVSETAGPLGSSFIGDRPAGDAVRYAVSFDLGELAADVDTVESAELRATWMQQSGDPWGRLGGGTVFQQVVYDSVDDSFDAAAVGSAMGLFGGVGDTDVMRDAAWALDEALGDPATYGDLLQLRIRWLLDSFDNNAYDSVTLDPNDLELTITYLAP